MSGLGSKQLENAHAFLKHINALDGRSLSDLLAPDFQHQSFPGTIVHDGHGTRTKEGFMNLFHRFWVQVFDKVTFGEPLDVIHGSNKVTFHVKSDGITKTGKEYHNEYMLTFHFEGEKIIKVNEFVDSKYSAAFFAALAPK
ncbi:hypothetical protein C8F04DRAFT_1255151 [Mycena alexandri]|uniref:SnoaL-like domain-containing protein n=1 Tax=Mycena alexandri TaxID=1745969 RepID=A0AAD6T462_9AGAR|nr:hypothetical protein C8F04DRAFT_1255151 [Mycena alexandri]